MSAHAVAHSIALSFHIAAGSAGLVLGPIAMFSAKRRGVHTRTGEAYYYVFVVLFVSALALAALNFSQVWWLAPVGAFSYGFALMGYRAAKRRRAGWLIRHVSGQGGSYIAMTTALLVVNVNGVAGATGLAGAIPWIAPTVIGSPIITWVNFQIAAGKRPKAWRRRTELAEAA